MAAVLGKALCAVRCTDQISWRRRRSVKNVAQQQTFLYYVVLRSKTVENIILKKPHSFFRFFPPSFSPNRSEYEFSLLVHQPEKYVEFYGTTSVQKVRTSWVGGEGYGEYGVRGNAEH